MQALWPFVWLWVGEVGGVILAEHWWIISLPYAWWKWKSTKAITSSFFHGVGLRCFKPFFVMFCLKMLQKHCMRFLCAIGMLYFRLLYLVVDIWILQIWLATYLESCWNNKTAKTVALVLLKTILTGLMYA